MNYTKYNARDSDIKFEVVLVVKVNNINSSSIKRNIYTYYMF